MSEWTHSLFCLFTLMPVVDYVELCVLCKHKKLSVMNSVRCMKCKFHDVVFFLL